MRLFRTVNKRNVVEWYPAYDITDYPYEQLKTSTLRESHKKVRNTYLEEFGAFDIETTSYLGADDRYHGFMYIWQICVGGLCCYGRTWHEFQEFCDTLFETLDVSPLRRFVVYVHNLAFEFQFLRKLLSRWYGIDSVFSAQPRKPMKVLCSNGLELRCSYKLSNMSLYAATLNELGCDYYKADGDLDYSIYRDSNTPLNDTEFGYSMMDVLSLYHYIKAKMHNEGDTLTSIPLTSTGYVRRDCRNACKKSATYMTAFRRQKMTREVYILLKEAARGGDTAANRYLAGQTCSNVYSFDVTSSYPYQMLTQLYPSTRFYPKRAWESEAEIDKASQGTPLLFRALFRNIRIKSDSVNAYISLSKAWEYSGKSWNKMSFDERRKNRIANGRVLRAEVLGLTLTDIDWQILRKYYEWDEVAISDVCASRYAQLPEELRSVILDYFRQKCELAEERDKYPEDSDEYIRLNYLYMKSKNRLNGIFGMCFTDPVRDEIPYDTSKDVWGEATTPPFGEALEQFYTSRNSFLVYAWGVWTTAHARKHLSRLIDLCGAESIYWDTDSDKCMNPDFDAINRENELIKQLCVSRGAYADVNGHRYYLGVYEHETAKGAYREFKTLGAKKYAYVDHKGKLHCTISGVAKSKSPNHPDGARELGSLSHFNPGFTFREAGGLTLYYNDSDPLPNVGTCPSTYKLGITDEYAEAIGYNNYASNY